MKEEPKLSSRWFENVEFDSTQTSKVASTGREEIRPLGRSMYPKLLLEGGLPTLLSTTRPFEKKTCEVFPTRVATAPLTESMAVRPAASLKFHLWRRTGCVGNAPGG